MEIKSLDDAPIETWFVSWCRESYPNGNINDQINKVLRETQAHGCRIIRCFRYIGRGFGPEWEKALMECADYCRRNGSDIVLDEITRLGRPKDYNSKTRWWAQLSEREQRRLQVILKDIDVYAVEADAVDFHTQRSVQTKRGKAAKGNPGGRPKKKQPCQAGECKERRIDLKPWAIHLRKNRGLTYEAIAAKVSNASGKSITIAGIHKWINPPAPKVGL